MTFFEINRKGIIKIAKKDETVKFKKLYQKNKIAINDLC